MKLKHELSRRKLKIQVRFVCIVGATMYGVYDFPTGVI